MAPRRGASPSNRLGPAATLAVLALLLVSTAPAAGDHGPRPDPPPHCDGDVGEVNPGSWNVARVRSLGYAQGTVGGVGLEQVDRLAQAAGDAADEDVPRVLEREDGDVAADLHVVGKPISIHYPALENDPDLLGDDLPGDVPSATVGERFGKLTGPLAVDGEVTKNGRMFVTGVFSGRITVWAEETAECSSVEHADGRVLTVSAHKVRLSGYATPLTHAEDPHDGMGTALNLDISTGNSNQKQAVS